MSVNTLPYNPALLQDVANAVQGYLPTTGITQIQTPDNNIVASVVGNIADLSLASNITISGNVNCSTSNCSNLVVATFNNPFTSNQPTSNGQVLSGATNGALSWITPSAPTTTGLLKFFYQDNGQNVVQTGSTTVNIWTNTFTNLDPTKQYILRVNASWYLGSTSGGVIGAGFCRFLKGATPVQQYNLFYNDIDKHLPYCFIFNAYTPSSANELWTVFAQSNTGNLDTDTSDYFNVEIDEIQ